MNAQTASPCSHKTLCFRSGFRHLALDSRKAPGGAKCRHRHRLGVGGAIPRASRVPAQGHVASAEAGRCEVGPSRGAGCDGPTSSSRLCALFLIFVFAAFATGHDAKAKSSLSKLQKCCRRRWGPVACRCTGSGLRKTCRSRPCLAVPHANPRPGLSTQAWLHVLAAFVPLLCPPCARASPYQTSCQRPERLRMQLTHLCSSQAGFGVMDRGHELGVHLCSLGRQGILQPRLSLHGIIPVYPPG